MIEEDLRDYLASLETVQELMDDPEASGAIQQNRSEQTGPRTRIWFQRSGGTAVTGMTETFVHITDLDIECISHDVATAEALGQELRQQFTDWLPNEMGESFVHYIEVTDVQSDYQPKGTTKDGGEHWSALAISIHHEDSD